MNQSTTKSELSPAILKKIENAHFTHDEYGKAMRFLMSELGGLPEEAMVRHLANMYAAHREHADVRQVIGNKLELNPMWVVAEVYIKVGRA